MISIICDMGSPTQIYFMKFRVIMGIMIVLLGSRLGLDCIIRPEPSDASQTTPAQPRSLSLSIELLDTHYCESVCGRVSKYDNTTFHTCNDGCVPLSGKSDVLVRWVATLRMHQNIFFRLYVLNALSAAIDSSINAVPYLMIDECMSLGK